MSALRILIVEDDQDIRVTMDHAFSAHGYEVSAAANAATALELLDPNRCYSSRLQAA